MGSFQDLLNRVRTINMPSIDMPMPQEPQQPDFRVPSQMPGAYTMGVGMGPGIDHGITGNLSDIQSRPIDYGVKGGFNIANPFTYGNMKKAVEGTRAGDENIEYSDTPVGKIGEAANERNRMIQQLLQGY